MRRLAYTTKEVAQLSGLSRWTVRQAAKRGEIRSKRIGRRLLLHPDDVERVYGFDRESVEELTREDMKSLAEIRDLVPC